MCKHVLYFFLIGATLVISIHYRLMTTVHVARKSPSSSSHSTNSLYKSKLNTGSLESIPPTLVISIHYRLTLLTTAHMACKSPSSSSHFTNSLYKSKFNTGSLESIPPPPPKKKVIYLYQRLQPIFFI